MDVGKKHLEKAARERTRTARELLGPTGNKAPLTACYLMHTGMQCALKFRLLIQYGVTTTQKLRSRLPPEVFERLFQSRHGHDLMTLSDYAKLRRLLDARQMRSLIQGRVWKRMAEPSRPYSLRYGVESVPVGNAQDEVALGELLIKLLLE